jgi:hypothetical protein
LVKDLSFTDGHDVLSARRSGQVGLVGFAQIRIAQVSQRSLQLVALQGLDKTAFIFCDTHDFAHAVSIR